jgi:hypothetical protein
VGDTIAIELDGGGTRCYQISGSISPSEGPIFFFMVQNYGNSNCFTCTQTYICPSVTPTPTTTMTPTPTNPEIAYGLSLCSDPSQIIIGNFAYVGEPTQGQVLFVTGTEGVKACYTVTEATEGATFTVESVTSYVNCAACDDGPLPTPSITPTKTPSATPAASITPTRTKTPTPTRTPTSSPAVVYSSLGLLASGFNNRTDFDQPSTTARLSIICNGVRTLGAGQLPGTEGHVYYTGDCSTITSSATAPGKILYALTDVGIAPFYAPLENQSVTNGCQGWLTGAGGVILSTYPTFCSGGSSGCIQCGS